MGNPNSDLDSTFSAEAPGGPVAVYSDPAKSLSARGLTAQRLNPRYITGPGEGDFEQAFTVTTSDADKRPEHPSSSSGMGATSRELATPITAIPATTRSSRSIGAVLPAGAASTPPRTINGVG
jgi:hypothetical protein